MKCDPKDRHVLAAAVRANASGIVTFNIRDFPSEAADIFEIEIIHPDEFLLDHLDLAPATVIRELASQAAANRRNPRPRPKSSMRFPGPGCPPSPTRSDADWASPR
jgi:hypothetical protein